MLGSVFVRVSGSLLFALFGTQGSVSENQRSRECRSYRRWRRRGARSRFTALGRGSPNARSPTIPRSWTVFPRPNSRQPSSAGPSLPLSARGRTSGSALTPLLSLPSSSVGVPFSLPIILLLLCPKLLCFVFCGLRNGGRRLHQGHGGYEIQEVVHLALRKNQHLSCSYSFFGAFRAAVSESDEWPSKYSKVFVKV